MSDPHCTLDGVLLECCLAKIMSCTWLDALVKKQFDLFCKSKKIGFCCFSVKSFCQFQSQFSGADGLAARCVLPSPQR